MFWRRWDPTCFPLTFAIRGWIRMKTCFTSSSAAAAATKSLQSCPTLCDPIDDSPPGTPVPGILQARTLGWVAISFSNAWKWSCSVVSDSSQPHGLQPTRLLRPWDFPGKSTGVGCHCLLPSSATDALFTTKFIFTRCGHRRVLQLLSVSLVKSTPNS